MKESVIAMLEELIKQMEDMKLYETTGEAIACNVGIDASIKIVRTRIEHIRSEITA